MARKRASLRKSYVDAFAPMDKENLVVFVGEAEPDDFLFRFFATVLAKFSFR